MRIELGLIFLQSLLFWVDFEELFVLFKKKNPKGSKFFCFEEESEATEGHEYSLFSWIQKWYVWSLTCFSLKKNAINYLVCLPLWSVNWKTFLLWGNETHCLNFIIIQLQVLFSTKNPYVWFIMQVHVIRKKTTLGYSFWYLQCHLNSSHLWTVSSFDTRFKFKVSQLVGQTLPQLQYQGWIGPVTY